MVKDKLIEYSWNQVIYALTFVYIYLTYICLLEIT